MNWPRVFKALLAQLDTDQPLIIDPPRELLGRLPPTAPCISLDFSIWRQLGEQQRDVFFDPEISPSFFTSELVPPFFRRGVRGDASEASSFSSLTLGIPPDPPSQAKGGTPEAIVLFQPRAKERLSWWLYRLSARFPGRPLWLAGANAEGGRGIGKQVANVFGYEAKRVASLGRASLWHCHLPENPPPAPDPWREWCYQELRIHALPGVFGYQGLDDGTALLLEAIQPLTPQGRILDFGCGTGVVAACAGKLNPDARLTLADSDAPALESAARTLEANHLTGTISPADGWHGLSGSFDWILSNPPFHVGASADLGVTRALIEHAPDHLAVGGRLVLVANRHLPLEKALERAFGNLVKLAENTHFKVLSAGKNQKKEKRI